MWWRASRDRVTSRSARRKLLDEARRLCTRVMPACPAAELSRPLLNRSIAEDALHRESYRAR
jgi:hypothetical protein